MQINVHSVFPLADVKLEAITRTKNAMRSRDIILTHSGCSENTMDELMENNKMDELIAVINLKPRKTRNTLFIVKEAHFHFVVFCFASQPANQTMCLSSWLRAPSPALPRMASLAPGFGAWRTEGPEPTVPLHSREHKA